MTFGLWGRLPLLLWAPELSLGSGTWALEPSLDSGVVCFALAKRGGNSGAASSEDAVQNRLFCDVVLVVVSNKLAGLTALTSPFSNLTVHLSVLALPVAVSLSTLFP